MSENSGMTDAQAPTIGDSLRDVLGGLNLITLGSESEREEFRNLRLRVMALANESDRLIAERDALWQEAERSAKYIMGQVDALVALEDYNERLMQRVGDLIADRDRLAAEVLRLQAERDAYRAALESITRIPSTDDSGQFCTHHTTPDGEYAGTEYHDPVAVAMHMHLTAVDALSPATSTGSEVGK